jgi:hypothetical protein
MGQKRKNLVSIACSFSTPSVCPQATVALLLLRDTYQQPRFLVALQLPTCNRAFLMRFSCPPATALGLYPQARAFVGELWG